MFNVQLKKKNKSHYKQFEILLFLATRTTPPFRLLFNWIDALVFSCFLWISTCSLPVIDNNSKYLHLLFECERVNAIWCMNFRYT